MVCLLKVLFHQLDAEATFRALVAVGTVVLMLVCLLVVMDTILCLKVCVSKEAKVQAVSLDIQQAASNYLNVLEPKKVGAAV